MIAVVGALDTKADEFTFLIREISSLGHEQVIIDFGPFSTAGPDVRALGVRYIGPDEVAVRVDVLLGHSVLVDPAGQGVESVRPIRDEIERRVLILIDELSV